MLDDTPASVQCPRCGAPSGAPCASLRDAGTPLAGNHPERGRSQPELLAGGYLKYALVDDTGRPLFLWRRRTQRAIVRDRHR